MFRRHSSGKGDGLLGGGGGGTSLPVSSFGSRNGFTARRNPNTSLLSFLTDLFERTFRRDRNGSSSIDGSASSIHVTPTIVQTWQRASVPTKVTWISFFTTIIMIYLGYRCIRYYNTGIYLNCTSNKCTFKLVHTGYKKPTTVDVGRHQIVRTEPVLVKPDGTFVSGNASIKIDYQKSKTTKDGLNYKGPDSDGNYLSYAIYFKDKSDEQTKYTDAAEEIIDVQFDITKLKEVPTIDIEDDTNHYRLIVRKHIPFVGQSKRRVRMMTQKVESYIKKRRQKMILREVSGPQWQGVVLVVVGIIGFILTLLIGQFKDDNTASQSGPGFRRQLHINKPVSNLQGYNQNKIESILHEQHIPSQYEVISSTSQQQQSTSSSASGFRQNTTTVTSRKAGTPNKVQQPTGWDARSHVPGGKMNY